MDVVCWMLSHDDDGVCDDYYDCLCLMLMLMLILMLMLLLTMMSGERCNMNVER